MFCRVSVKRNVGRRLLWMGKGLQADTNTMPMPCREFLWANTVDCLGIWAECKLNFLMLEAGLMSINTVPITTFPQSLLLSLIMSAFLKLPLLNSSLGDSSIYLIVLAPMIPNPHRDYADVKQGLLSDIVTRWSWSVFFF